MCIRDSSRFKRIGEATGATVNDVTLAVCAGALRKYLTAQHSLPEKPLIAMVPVSLHGETRKGGNQVAMILANLATDVADPLDRLRRIVASTAAAKARLSGMARVVKIAHAAESALNATPDSRDKTVELYSLFATSGRLNEAQELTARWSGRDALDPARGGDGAVRPGTADDAALGSRPTAAEVGGGVAVPWAGACGPVGGTLRPDLRVRPTSGRPPALVPITALRHAMASRLEVPSPSVIELMTNRSNPLMQPMTSVRKPGRSTCFSR